MVVVPTLHVVELPEHVRASVQRFNEEARRWPYARQLLLTTTYWVLDAETGMFGPSKFVGFRGLDAAAYDEARAGRSNGTAFDGAVSRGAVEHVLQQAYRSDRDLAERLVLWAESTFAAGIVDRISRDKWRFVVVPGTASGSRVDVSRAVQSDRLPIPATAPTVGRDYRPADENIEVAERDPFSTDPVAVDRANRAHAVTQNAVAAFLRTLGIAPRSPTPDEPDADLLWQHNGTVYVAEVKSITESNEEKQLRLGLGQVLRYRQLLAARGHHVVPVLVSERPAPESWQDLCAQVGVIVAWPGALDSLIPGEGRGDDLFDGP